MSVILVSDIFQYDCVMWPPSDTDTAGQNQEDDRKQSQERYQNYMEEVNVQLSEP